MPGTTQVREAIVRTSLVYLDALASESADDPALLLELANGYQKIGDVQGYAVVPNLGQPAAALESHRKGLALAERLARDDAGPAVQRLLVRAHDRVGALLRVRQHSAGLEHLRRAIPAAQRLDPSDPANAEVLIDLYGHLGEAESTAGNMPTAMGHWRRTLEIGKMAVARKPGDIAQAALGVAHWHLSRALQRNGDLEGAARHARESVVINEALVHRYPRDISRRRSLLNSYEQEGYISYEVGSPAYDDPAAAAARQARALAIAEQLAAEDPHNVRGLSDLAISQRNMCYALVPRDPEAAERMCRAGLGTADRLGNLVTHYRPQLLAGLGAALHRQPGKRSAAEQFIRDAVRLQDSGRIRSVARRVTAVVAADAQPAGLGDARRRESRKRARPASTSARSRRGAAEAAPRRSDRQA